MKNILVLYRKTEFDKRRTVRDHLYSFKRYAQGCRFVYFNVLGPGSFSKALLAFEFDAVILHYTFLALRFGKWEDYQAYYQSIRPMLTRLKGIKVLMPHDEYFATRALWDLASVLGVRRIYASCYPHDYAALFPPDKTGGEDLCKTVLTGYVEESLIPRLSRLRKSADRPLDIGYRAAESSFFFGRHGLVKSRVAKELLAALPRFPNLKADIRLTGDRHKNSIQGDKWLRFLASCRTAPGCLGGSSLMDPEGRTREAVIAYTKTHPDAGYEEVRDHCYQTPDGQIQTYLLGPRHFECALTRTCQLLVEGDYHGILSPGVDYIEIKADYSNLDDVLRRIADKDYCARIAEQCYEHLVASGRYTYRQFANDIADDLSALAGNQSAASPAAFRRMRFSNAAHVSLHRLGLTLRGWFYWLTNLFSRLCPKTYEKMRARLFPGRARDTFKQQPK